MKAFLLTFDVEEFDWPLEFGRPLSSVVQLRVTDEGVHRLLALLSTRGVVATFFITGEFARARSETVRAIVVAGHEAASHGLSHRDDYRTLVPGVAVARLRDARSLLADVTGRPIHGFRAPRLRPCAPGIIRDAGFSYDASPHPTWVPGRYNGLRFPRQPWSEDGIVRVPISVLPVIRLPVSWLWYRALGPRLGPLAARAACVGGPYLHLYFHPWEASDLRRFGIPCPLAVRSNGAFIDALDRLIVSAKTYLTPSTIRDFVDLRYNSPGG